MSKFISAMGKPVDMAGIRSKNEKVRAIGNMSVNSRGDVIDSNNQIVGQSTQRVNRVYNKTTVPTTKTDTVRETKATPSKQITKAAETPTQPVMNNQPTIKPDSVSIPTAVSVTVPTSPPVGEPQVQFLEEMSEDEIEYLEDLDAGILELPTSKSKKK
jgi:hypothetical protein